MERLFFGGWDSLLRTLVVGVLAYVVLVALLRVSGKRTLSKMNAFDFVVTVALGSTLATILLSRDVTLAQGALAFALLIGLQFAVTWSSVRAHWVRQLATGEPQMLLHRGQLRPGPMRRTRVAEDEVLAALRAAGVPSPAEAEAVILETDGSFSVLPRRGGDTPQGIAGLESPARLHHFALRVADPRRAAAFYERLGLKRLRELQAEGGGLRAVWMSAGGTVLMLERELRGKGEDSASHLLAFAADDLDRAGRLLGEAGAAVEDRTASTLYFRDPDGHRLGFSVHRFEPPA